MIDFLPGATPRFDMPNVAISSSDVEADVAELESVADEIESNIISDLVTDYSSVNRDVSTITSNVIGDIGNSLDGIDTLSTNLANKVNGGIQKALAESYAKIVDLGFNIPTIEDVKYGNVSGDYMGSMTGLTPNTVTEYQPPTIEDYPIQLSADTPPGGGYTTGGTNDTLIGGCANPSIEMVFNQENQFVGYDDSCLMRHFSGWAMTFLDAQFGEWTDNGKWYQPWLYGATELPPGQYRLYGTVSIDNSPHSFNPLVLVLPANYSLMSNDIGVLLGAEREGNGYKVHPCVSYSRLFTVSEVCYDTPTPTPVPTPTPEPTPTVPGASCPVPTFECTPDYGWNVKPIGTYGDPACKRLEMPETDWQALEESLHNLIGMAANNSTPSSTIAGAIHAITGSKFAIMPELVNRFSKWLTKTIKEVSQSAGCEGEKFTAIAVPLGILNFFDQWTKALPPQSIVPMQQVANTLCQYKIPNPSDADSAFLNATIDQETWKCYHKAAGNFIGEFEQILDAKRTKADPLQVSQLYRRRQLDKATYEKRMRANGVTKAEDVTDIFNLTQSWPGISDVVRFLVKDVADDKIVTRFKMDDDFPEKWKGELLKYAEAIGVPEELGKYYWRAHWHIPSFTQLTDMLHRLRPGEVPENLQVTKEDVFTALKQDDWLPYWAERMIETSYRPVTKTDAVRAFQIHAIDEAELKKHYLNVGYTDASADFYVKYQAKLRGINQAKTSGLPTIRMLTRQYSKCEITEEQYRKAMEKLVLSPEHEAQALEAARMAKQTESQKLAMKMVQVPFKLGLIDYVEATDMLSQSEIDPGCVRSLVDAWSLQQLKRPKHLAAGQLCKMRERGIITTNEQIAALIRNNWSEEDARRIAMECDVSVSEKQLRRAQATAEKARREQERLRKEQAKRLKLEACGPPSCPKNTLGGKLDPPNIVPDLSNP